MSDYRKVGPTRVSRIVLIKDTQSLILNDQLIIRYVNRSAFLIVWTLCKALCSDKDVQQLGGLDSRRLFELSAREGLKLTSEASLITLWRDIIELHRPRMPWTKFYEMINLKHDRKVSIDTLPYEEASKLLQSIFYKIPPPADSELHKNVRLFAVKALPEQIAVFQTEHDINLAPGAKPLTSDITKYRKDREEVGYISWVHKVNVNDDGSSDSVISVEVVNLISKPLVFISLPVWADNAADAKKRKLKAWLPNNQEIPIEHLIGEDKSKNYEFCLRLPKPVPPGNTLRFFYSYFTPGAFKKGRDYFEWYLDHAQCKYEVEISFAKSWVVSSPVVFDADKPDLFPARTKNSRVLSWLRYFPVPGHKYRIEFFLSRTTPSRRGRSKANKRRP